MTKSRLIAANELTDGKGVFSSVVQFKRIDGELTAYVTVEDIIKVIENQPTAYDTNKVVEQIKEYFKREIDAFEEDRDIDYILKHNKAVCKIVKGGGTDET